MERKPLGLIILWWAEMIIAARLLLFFIPLLIQKFFAGDWQMTRISDIFLIIVSMSALLYFLIGFVSLMGYKFWKFFHYLTTVLIVILTIGLMGINAYAGIEMPFIQFLPIVFSCFCLILMNLLQTKPMDGKLAH